ncbi:SPOR domain-containing protein, partial [bacterium]|nr:SPOR domain-containing protein [bacterium]
NETIKQKLLPVLVRRLLAKHRRSVAAGEVYLSAYLNEVRPRGIIIAMQATADSIMRSGKNLELAANLEALAGKSFKEEMVIKKGLGEDVHTEKADSELDETEENRASNEKLADKEDDQVDDFIIETGEADEEEEQPFDIQEDSGRAILSRPESGWSDVSEVDSSEKVSDNKTDIPEGRDYNLNEDDLDQSHSIESTPDSEDPHDDYDEIEVDAVENAPEVEFVSEENTKPFHSTRENDDIWKRNGQKNTFFSRYRYPLIIVTAVFCLIILLLLILPNKDSGTHNLSKPGTITSEMPFTIQVAAYREENRAISHMNDLRVKGIDSYIVYPSGEGNRWYRVRFGNYASATLATQQADSLKSRGLISDFFVSRFEVGKIPKEQNQ